ncbi:hypothetical protein DFP72DRAFT_1141487, partial [Ephemerocybe angulata]
WCRRPSTFLSTRPPNYPHVRPTIQLSVHLPIHPSIHLPIYSSFRIHPNPSDSAAMFASLPTYFPFSFSFPFSGSRSNPVLTPEPSVMLEDNISVLAQPSEDGAYASKSTVRVGPKRGRVEDDLDDRGDKRLCAPNQRIRTRTRRLRRKGWRRAQRVRGTPGREMIHVRVPGKGVVMFASQGGAVHIDRSGDMEEDEDESRVGIDEFTVEAEREAVTHLWVELHRHRSYQDSNPNKAFGGNDGEDEDEEEDGEEEGRGWDGANAQTRYIRVLPGVQPGRNFAFSDWPYVKDLEAPLAGRLVDVSPLRPEALGSGEAEGAFLELGEVREWCEQGADEDEDVDVDEDEDADEDEEEGQDEDEEEDEEEEYRGDVEWEVNDNAGETVGEWAIPPPPPTLAPVPVPAPDGGAVDGDEEAMDDSEASSDMVLDVPPPPTLLTSPRKTYYDCTFHPAPHDAANHRIRYAPHRFDRPLPLGVRGDFARYRRLNESVCAGEGWYREMGEEEMAAWAREDFRALPQDPEEGENEEESEERGENGEKPRLWTVPPRGGGVEVCGPRRVVRREGREEVVEVEEERRVVGLAWCAGEGCEKDGLMRDWGNIVVWFEDGYGAGSWYWI